MMREAAFSTLFLRITIVNRLCNPWQIANTDKSGSPVNISWTMQITVPIPLLSLIFESVECWHHAWTRGRTHARFDAVEIKCMNLYRIYTLAMKLFTHLSKQDHQSLPSHIMLISRTTISLLTNTAINLAVWEQSWMNQLENSSKDSTLYSTLVNTKQWNLAESSKAYYLPNEQDLPRHIGLVRYPRLFRHPITTTSAPLPRRLLHRGRWIWIYDVGC